LRRRLGLQGAGFALLLLSAFAAAVYWGIAGERQEDLRAETRQLAATAASQLPLISHEFSEEGNVRKFRNDREVVDLDHHRAQRVRWFDPRARLLLEEGRLAMPAASPPPQRSNWQFWPGGLSLWQPVYTLRRRGAAGRPQLAGYVQVGLSDRAAAAELERLRRGLLLGGIAAVIVALVLGRRMLRQAFLPLQRQVLALERFTADTSHELRHPLTLLRTLVASADPQASPLLRRIDALAAQMGQLLNDLLFLARQEQGVSEGAVPLGGWCRFDLLELLDDLLSAYGPEAARRGVRLRLEPPAGLAELPLRGQPEQLQRLFTNLLLNAIRFSPEGGLVRVRPRPVASRLRVELIDQGPGIAAPNRERVFERFWREAPARSSLARAPEDGSGHSGHSGHSGNSGHSVHSGLGLPIARAIARRHGGEVSVAAGDPGHSVLLVDLPAG
jgi:signal transduction histidine kinase